MRDNFPLNIHFGPLLDDVTLTTVRFHLLLKFEYEWYLRQRINSHAETLYKHWVEFSWCMHMPFMF